MSEYWNLPTDRAFRLPGTGLATTWLCMGCRQPRRVFGARGAGIKKRCALCVEKARSKG